MQPVFGLLEYDRRAGLEHFVRYLDPTREVLQIRDREGATEA